METAYATPAKGKLSIERIFSIIVFDEMWDSSKGSNQEPTVLVSEI